MEQNDTAATYVVIVIVIVIGVMFVSVMRSVIEGRCDVYGRGGYRVNRNRHRRQHRVSIVLHGGTRVSVDALVIRVRDPMAAVVAAQNHRAAERDRRAENAKNLKLQLPSIEPTKQTAKATKTTGKH